MYYPIKMSKAFFRPRLRNLLRRQRHLLVRLAAAPPLVRGSFARVHTRCGKPTCWCAQAAAGHPHARITWSQNGRLVTRKVPREFIPRVAAWTGNYRRVRAARKQLQRLHAQIVDLLQQQERAVLDRTRETLPFLDVHPKMSASTRRRRQKTPEPPQGLPSQSVLRKRLAGT